MATTKQITDNPSKSPAAAGDVLLLRDVTSNSDKKTTVSGLAGAVAASLPIASVDSSAVNRSTVPWGIAMYSTFTATGGQIVTASTETTLNFNTLETDGHTGIALPAAGQVQVDGDGVYMVVLNSSVMDSPQANNYQSLQYSIDGGTTWIHMTTFQGPHTATGVGQGMQTTTALVNLPAAARVRARYLSAGGATRLAAASAARKYECSLSIVRVA